MSSLNRVIILGRLGKDPEVRATQNGNRNVSFSVATSEKWKDKTTGERKENTHWHNVSIWNEGLGKIAEQYLKKGHLVLLEGQLETRKWKDQGGADRYTTEVVLRLNASLRLMPQGNKERSEYDDDPPAEKPPAGAPPKRIDDEVPF
jgi:single-strand DNA-binding protein